MEAYIDDIHTMSPYDIGDGVLGLMFPSTGRIEIRAGLDYEQRDEVTMHERLHRIYKHLSEYFIRIKTHCAMKSKGYNPIYH